MQGGEGALFTHDLETLEKNWAPGTIDFFIRSSGQARTAIHDWEEQMVPFRSPSGVHCCPWERPLYPGLSGCSHWDGGPA